MGMRVVCCLCAFLCFASAQRNEALHQLFTDYYEDRLRDSPELATMRGRNEYNDRWTDWTRAAVERRAAQRERSMYTCYV